MVLHDRWRKRLSISSAAIEDGVRLWGLEKLGTGSRPRAGYGLLLPERPVASKRAGVPINIRLILPSFSKPLFGPPSVYISAWSYPKHRRCLASTVRANQFTTLAANDGSLCVRLLEIPRNGSKRGERALLRPIIPPIRKKTTSTTSALNPTGSLQATRTEHLIHYVDP